MCKISSQQFIYVFFLLLLIGCTRSATPVGDMLSKETGNKVYKKVHPDSLQAYFKNYLQANAKSFKNPQYLTQFYTAHNFEPLLIDKFYADSSLARFVDYLARMDEHGLSAQANKAKAVSDAFTQLADKERVREVEDAYERITRAELLAAEALTQYSFALEYGVVNPRKALPRYFIPVDRPDSTAFFKVLNVHNLVAYLDSIQPKNATYKALQSALGRGDTTNRAALVANMERLRWKYPVDSAHLIYVNVPAYELYVIRDRKVDQSMKVVVGKADGHETPMLLSKIHSVQVNPIWNIPTSIAKKEILAQAKEDRYYLANHGMDVYRNGVKVADPDTIDWSVYSEANLPYSFKQQPGDTNSLGLIKFLFNNGSSVYLHDTPVKATFSRTMRASSHGCVRVEKPLELAYALFGDGEDYELIKEEMSSDEPKAKTISLTPEVPVVLDYVTCKLDASSNLTFYPDVYKLDAMLYRLLQ